MAEFEDRLERWKEIVRFHGGDEQKARAYLAAQLQEMARVLLERTSPYVMGVEFSSEKGPLSIQEGVAESIQHNTITSLHISLTWPWGG